MATAEMNLSNTLDELSKIMAEHLGVRSGVSTPLIPHTQLSAINRGAYVLTNVSDSRTLDPTATSLGQIANILASLISDLQSIKVLGGASSAGGAAYGASTVQFGVYY